MTIQEAIKHYEQQVAGKENIFAIVADNPVALAMARKINEANEMALQALREQEERENQPLTLAELRQMNGETVYCLDLNADVKVSAPHVGIINISYSIPGEWGVYNAKGMTLYRTRPENMK